MFNKVSKLAKTFAVALSIFAISACGDSPTDATSSNVRGVVVLDSEGAALARVTSENGISNVVGKLMVGANATELYQVFLIENNDARRIVDGFEYKMSASIPSASIASASVQQNDRLTVVGKTAGTTTIDLAVFHKGKEVFVVKIPLVVR